MRRIRGIGGRRLAVVAVLLPLAGAALWMSRDSRSRAERGKAAANAIVKLDMVVGAADISDAFYSAAGALSTFFAAHRRDIDVNLTVQVTPGSVFNAQSVIAGDMDIALVQSAVQSAAIDGRGPWEGMQPQKSLRSICGLFTGALMLITRDESSIRGLPDLAGKRVGVNIPGSGTNMNARDLLDFSGHAEWADRVERVEAPTSSAIAMLNRGELDALFINSGHPADAVIRLIRESKRPLRFVPIDQVQPFLRRFPAYVSHYIPLGIYPGIANRGEVRTIGAPTVLTTTDAMPEEVGYRLAKTLYDGFDELRKLHPVFGDINRSDVLMGLDAPLQAGCARYFREAGVIRASMPSAMMDVTVLLASAPPTSGYYHLTAGVANRVNQDRQRHGVRVFVASTEGSVDNINYLISGEASFGIAAGQTLRDATRAQGIWSKSVPQRKLRSLARVGSDTYFLVVAADAMRDGALSPGARISIGLPGSGEAALAELLLESVPGAEKAKLIRVDVVEGRKMMAAHEVDATLFPVFHESSVPPENIGRQLVESIRFSERPLRLLPLGPPANHVATSTFYQTGAFIPPAAPGEKGSTLSSMTTPVMFFTSVDVQEEVVKIVCEALLESARLATGENRPTPAAGDYAFLRWRYLFGGHPIAMHDAMAALLREKTGEPLDPGPSPYENYLVIGSGPPDNEFAMAAGALAAVINQDKEYGQPLMVVKPSLNGPDNLDRLSRGEFDVCLAEGIGAEDAYLGRGRWSGRPERRLRQLATAYVSSLAVLVNDDDPASASLRDIADIEGQRVSLPVAWNAGRDNAISIFNYSRFLEGLGAHTLLSADEPGGFGPGMELLKSGAIRALFFTSGGHPNKYVDRIIGDLPLRPLSVTGLHNLLVSDKGYSATGIPALAYGKAANGDARETPTLGIPVGILALDSLPDAEAYRIVWRLAQRLEQAARLHPAFSGMTDEMLAGDGAVPLHEGARRAYHDAGLILDEENRKVRNVVITAMDPYSNGLEMSNQLSKSVNRIFRTFRAHTDVSNGVDISAQFLDENYVEFGIFPAIAFFDPAVAPKLADFRSLAWFGRERFVCITGADSGISAFADLEGRSIGLPGGFSMEAEVFDALCRVLRPANPPAKVWMEPHDFMAALVEGRIDAAILTIGRLEAWLDAANLTPASDLIRYVDFSKGFGDDAGRKLAEMGAGLTTHRFSVPGEPAFDAPAFRVANVMLATRSLSAQQATWMAWMLDPDNADTGISLIAPGTPESPGVRSAIWRNLPVPLHDGVEGYLRAKESGEMSVQNPERVFR